LKITRGAQPAGAHESVLGVQSMNANPQELSTRVSCHFNANSVSVRQQPGKWGKEFIMRKYRQVIGDINKMILDYNP